jgi:hypothetical protein
MLGDTVSLSSPHILSPAPDFVNAFLEKANYRLLTPLGKLFAVCNLQSGTTGF